jgi:hypothetical protein
MTHQGSHPLGVACTLLAKRPKTISAVAYAGARRRRVRPAALSAAGAVLGSTPGLA